MNDFGTVTAPNTVRLERLLPGPVDLVWQYLTDPDKRGTWLAKGPMELHAGGEVELRFDFPQISDEPIPERYRSVEKGHTQRGHVTQCEPPHLLCFTWNEKEGKTPSEVRFELTQQGDRTRLIVTHSRLPDRKEMVSVASGWHAHLAAMADRLEQRASPAFWTNVLQLNAEYEKRIS